MLLRDSEIARRVRAYLLDVEEGSRNSEVEVPEAGYVSLDRRVTHLESAVSHIGSVLQELGPVIGRISVRLERVDRRLQEMERRQVSTERVVGAMSRRLADVADDVQRLARDSGRRPPHRRHR